LAYWSGNDIKSDKLPEKRGNIREWKNPFSDSLTLFFAAPAGELALRAFPDTPCARVFRPFASGCHGLGRSPLGQEI